MKQQHTPGPWCYRERFVLAKDKRETIIAEIMGSAVCPSTIADGYLCAAAPDMKATLEGVENNMRVLVDVAACLPESGTKRAIIDVLNNQRSVILGTLAKVRQP